MKRIGISIAIVIFASMGISTVFAAKSMELVAPHHSIKVITLDKININDADVPTLMLVKGIDQACAEAIVAYREKNGTFVSVDELLKVGVIDQKILEKISNQLLVG